MLRKVCEEAGPIRENKALYQISVSSRHGAPALNAIRCHPQSCTRLPSSHHSYVIGEGNHLQSGIHEQANNLIKLLKIVLIPISIKQPKGYAAVTYTMRFSIPHIQCLPAKNQPLLRWRDTLSLFDALLKTLNLKEIEGQNE